MTNKNPQRLDRYDHDEIRAAYAAGISVNQLMQEYIFHLRLDIRPIVTVGKCKVGDRIYRVENERLVGQIMPQESMYQVCEKSNIVCSGDYAEHITCQNSAGVLVPVAADMFCIVARDIVRFCGVRRGF